MMMNTRARFARQCGSLVAVTGLAAQLSAGTPPDHLLISEVTLLPFTGQFIEIHNPTPSAIDLTNYYLADFSAYWRLPGFPALPNTGDFIARFPPGASIAAGGTVVVTPNADTFLATYGIDAHFELPPSSTPVPDMLPAYFGSIAGGAGVNSTGEGVTLFFWNQQSDLVEDVDAIRAGIVTGGNDIPNKTNFMVDGPDPDTTPSAYLTDAMTMPFMTAAAPSGFSHKRLYLETGQELNTNGNGITNHDETSEWTFVTWDGTPSHPFTPPTPGVSGPLPHPPGQCPADIYPPKKGGDDVVDINDLLTVIGNWGATGQNVGDVNGDLVVDVNDLLAIVGTWGPCA